MPKSFAFCFEYARAVLPGNGAWLPGCVLLACVAVASTAWGQESSYRYDHDRARAVARSGAIQPLESVLRSLNQTYPGEVLEVELHQYEGQWIYDIRLLQTNGQLRRLIVNAEDASVIDARPRMGLRGGRNGPPPWRGWRRGGAMPPEATPRKLAP